MRASEAQKIILGYTQRLDTGYGRSNSLRRIRPVSGIITIDGKGGGVQIFAKRKNGGPFLLFVAQQRDFWGPTRVSGVEINQGSVRPVTCFMGKSDIGNASLVSEIMNRGPRNSRPAERRVIIRDVALAVKKATSPSSPTEDDCVGSTRNTTPILV